MVAAALLKARPAAYDTRVNVLSERGILRDVMFRVASYQGPFSVPMYSDAKVGWSWGTLKKMYEPEQVELMEAA